jgi:hypothetical protein
MQPPNATAETPRIAEEEKRSFIPARLLSAVALFPSLRQINVAAILSRIRERS